MGHRAIDLSKLCRAEGVCDVLTERELAVHEAALRKYATYRLHTKLHAIESIETSIKNINSFVAHVAKPIWKCDEDDWDDWNKHLVTRERRDGSAGLAVSTQRIYQSSVRTCIDFVMGRRGLCDEIYETFGCRILQFASRENSIVHYTEREGAKYRRALPHEHMEMIFAAMDRNIERAKVSRRKGYWTRCRDKVMVFLAYAVGMRREEIATLTTHSFSRNPNEPCFGNFGLCHILGKGTHGGKWRTATIFHPMVREVMAWYLEAVRPAFVREAETDQAYPLFLTERGGAVSDDVPYQAFRRILKEAGLADCGYDLHSLRHAHITESVHLIGIDKTQQNVGHEHRVTTEGYYHPSPQHAGKEVERAVNQGMAWAEKQLGRRTQRENDEEDAS